MWKQPAHDCSREFSMAVFRNIRVHRLRHRYSHSKESETHRRPRMHGIMGKPRELVARDAATSRVMLMLLVVMTGIAPVSLYLLVPALPKLATSFGRDISIAQ